MGLAKRVDLHSIGGVELKIALTELLSNPVYMETAKRKSHMFQSQAEPPLVRALWWIDYVLTHADVSHLKNRKLSEMNFIVKHSVDLVAVILVVFTLGFVLLLLSLCCFCCGWWGVGKVKLE